MEFHNGINNQHRSIITFFHIPKTGGRFLSANTIELFKSDLIHNKVNLLDKVGKSRHQSFKPLDYDQRVAGMSCLRNPVDRSISHYFYLLQNKLSGDIKTDKKAFFDYIDQEDTPMHNYQSKFISVNTDSWDLTDQEIAEAVINKSLIKDRLSKIKYLVKTEDINKDLSKVILTDIYLMNGMAPNTKLINSLFDSPHFKNPESKQFRDSLTSSEIKKIEDIVQLDLEIYETQEYFK
jgi:hypothetical protein